MKEEDEKTKKNVYHSPKLRVYGDLGELTEAQSGTMSSDGAYGMVLKTA